MKRNEDLTVELPSGREYKRIRRWECLACHEILDDSHAVAMHDARHEVEADARKWLTDPSDTRTAREASADRMRRFRAARVQVTQVPPESSLGPELEHRP